MKIGVIFGGKSCEHDISVITGVMTLNAAAVRHEAVAIYIDGNGEWFTGKQLCDMASFNGGKCKKKRVHLKPAKRGLYGENGRLICNLDAVIVCTHGVNGEDGALAGLLNLTDIPYAGSGLLASAVGMDKAAQKRLYRDAGLRVTPFVEISKHETEDKFFDCVGRIGDLKFPLMVKPSSLGSSIGIGRASDFKQLFTLLDQGFEWDNKIVVEEALTDFIEVNCAVLGYGSKLLVSQIEQPLSDGFLSYSDKYESGGGKGETGRYMPAHISIELGERVRQTAKTVFSLLGCAGVARVDFLIKDQELYVNEINTVPGSMSSYLFAFDGMEFCTLIDKLLEVALEVKRQRGRLRYTFDSNVLKGAGKKSAEIKM